MTVLNTVCERMIKYITKANKAARSKKALPGVELMKFGRYAAEELQGPLVYMFKPAGIGEEDANGRPIEIGAAYIRSETAGRIFVVTTTDRGNEKAFNQYTTGATADDLFNLQQRLISEGFQRSEF